MTNKVELKQFCDDGIITKYISMGHKNYLNITNYDQMLVFIGKFYGLTPAHPELKKSYKEVVELFSTRFELRVNDWAQRWYDARDNKKIWDSAYRHRFLKQISASRERRTLQSVMADTTLKSLEFDLKRLAQGDRGADAVAQLAFKTAELNCLMMMEEPSTMTDILSRKAIESAMEALINNVDMLRSKQIDETRIVKRFIPLWCSLLPLFKHKHFLHKVCEHEDQFENHNFLKFMKSSMKKDPRACMLVMLAYSHASLNDLNLPYGYAKQLKTGNTDISPLSVILNTKDASVSAPFGIQMVNFVRKPPQE